MARPLQITINSIANGQQSFEDFPGEGQFNFSRGIDPDIVANFDSARPRSGGVITPVPVSNQLTTALTKSILAIMTPSTDVLSKTYIVTTGGELISFTTGATGLSDQTSIATATGSQAHGAAYYNDFIYLLGTGTSGGDDVSRFGPLSGTPTFTNGFWKTTLGLPALDGTIATSTVNNVEYPPHWGHVHVDGVLYFADFTSGAGILNKIKTDSSGADDGSARNVLDLPFDYQLTDIESYGNDLVVCANQFSKITNSNMNTANPALFFWDTFDPDFFYKTVSLPEFTLVTALQNKGGIIYVMGGSPSSAGNNVRGGHTIGVYDGADGVTILKSIADGYPPFAGAIDTFGNRVSWGTQVSQDNNRAAVLAIGSKSEAIPRTSINCIAESTLTAVAEDDAVVTALSYPFRRSGTIPRVVSASFSTSQTKASLDAISSSATQTSILQFGAYNIGEPFRVTKIRIPLSEAVAAGVTITPTLLFDDRQDSYALTTINNTNFSGKRNIVYKQPELTNTVSGVQAQGEHDFILELAFTGTTPTSVKFPITIELETIDD